MTELDVQGMACPEPVIRTKTLVETENPKDLTVVTDNPASQENVNRFLESQGFQTQTREEGGKFFTVASREELPEDLPRDAEPSDGGAKSLVFCPSDRMGKGDDSLGKKLMISYISTLKEMGPDLWRLVLVNAGVKLAVKDSPVVDALKALEASGVSILVCGTCLTHFDLIDDKAVGETTNMLDIITSMQLADKVIRV